MDKDTMRTCIRCGAKEGECEGMTPWTMLKAGWLCPYCSENMGWPDIDDKED